MNRRDFFSRVVGALAAACVAQPSAYVNRAVQRHFRKTVVRTGLPVTTWRLLNDPHAQSSIDETARIVELMSQSNELLDDIMKWQV